MKRLRSLLFIPALATAMMAKAHERGADALVVDLEDSIPPERKREARPMAIEAVKSLARHGATVMLRVNASPDLWRDDLTGMPLDALTAVMLPKVESREQVNEFAAALAAATPRAPRIAALLETPRGVMAAFGIASHPALCALGFGAEDYAAAIGVDPMPQALTWPAQQVLTCAHAFGLQSWGLAASIADVHDLGTFEKSVQAARSMGFTGSVCIHPRQVAIVNAGFSPTAQELQWAARVVEADAVARAAGKAAVLLDGRMIDLPIVERARSWLAQAR